MHNYSTQIEINQNPNNVLPVHFKTPTVINVAAAMTSGDKQGRLLLEKEDEEGYCEEVIQRAVV